MQILTGLHYNLLLKAILNDLLEHSFHLFINILSPALLTVSQLGRRRRQRKRRKLCKPHCNSLIPTVSSFAWNIMMCFPRWYFSDLFSSYSLTPITLGPRESVLISEVVKINNEVAKVTSLFSNSSDPILAACAGTA